MRRLVSIRLANWYHFTHQIFPVAGTTLFLGDNGSGKSTVLDAVQLALVADLGEVRFNRAANEQSRRNLAGYVRWKLGSEDEKRPGQVRFGRGNCASYVVLGFADDSDPRRAFACGIAMEAREDDTHVERHHFVLPGASTIDVPLLGPDGLRNLRDFKATLREISHARSFSDPGTYRAELRQRLGPLPDTFHRLLVRAADFRPIADVKKFVLDYLLDERLVDTASLQSNLEHYKQLEAKAKEAEQRLASLDEICGLGDSVVRERRTARSHRFLAQRAVAHLADENCSSLATKHADLTTQRAAREADVETFERQLRAVRGEHERVLSSLLKVEAYQQIKQVERDLERTREDCDRAEAADRDARKLLDGQRAVLDQFQSEPARNLRRARPDLFEEEEIVGASDVPKIVERLRTTLTREGALSGRDLRTWAGRLQACTERLTRVRLTLESDAKSLKEEGLALEREQKQIEQGQPPYGANVDAILHLLRSKLRAAAEPRPLCELIEIRDERWRDAVEGYLNTRRFDVIVLPADYNRALALYERHKYGYPLPNHGPVDIHSVALVDVEKVIADRRGRLPRSLAEQVETDDEYARAYVDWVMGDVVCVDNEQELRRHRSAITDTVMVYRNHAARQTDPRVYRRHFVGRAARERRIREIEARLASIAERFVETSAQIAWTKTAVSASTRAGTDAARLDGLVATASELEVLREQIVRLERQLAAIDRASIAELEAEATRLTARITELDEQRVQAHKDAASLATQLENLEGQIRTATETSERAFAEVVILLQDVDDEQRIVWEQRWEKELSQRGAAEVRDTFQRQAKIIEGRVEALKAKIVSAKAVYKERYGIAASVEDDDVTAFANEQSRWRDSQLPEYRSKIADAKERAIRQLGEDIVFRLRENLQLVRQRIDQLNAALRNIVFNNDRYQFTLEPARDHRPFYELVMNAHRVERDTLENGLSGESEMLETLRAFFERLVSGQHREVKSELERLADYREYFEYDMKIHHADNTHSLYSKVFGDKSGGETQTPFYIAIFAATHRVYQQLSHDHSLACGLLLLDEVFSKMDGPRIGATLKFARDLGLQLIMAAPKERAELVMPHAETTFFIHKDENGLPLVLEYGKDLVIDDGAASGEEGSPGEVAVLA